MSTALTRRAPPARHSTSPPSTRASSSAPWPSAWCSTSPPPPPPPRRYDPRQHHYPAAIRQEPQRLSAWYPSISGHRSSSAAGEDPADCGTGTSHARPSARRGSARGGQRRPGALLTWPQLPRGDPVHGHDAHCATRSCALPLPSHGRLQATSGPPYPSRTPSGTARGTPLTPLTRRSSRICSAAAHRRPAWARTFSCISCREYP